MALLPLDELDAGDTLAALESGERRRRAAAVEDLLLVAHWADLHASDPRWDPRPVPGMPRPPGSDRLVQIGGDGTPAVRELTIVELGVARSFHTLAARATVADVLDLRHRLPRLWALVCSLAAEPWLACKVAAKSRQLSAEVVHLVDDARCRRDRRREPLPGPRHHGRQGDRGRPRGPRAAAPCRGAAPPRDAAAHRPPRAAHHRGPRQCR